MTPDDDFQGGVVMVHGMIQTLDEAEAKIERLGEALTEITEACRSGDFYKDYDEACAIIGRCDEALAL